MLNLFIHANIASPHSTLVVLLKLGWVTMEGYSYLYQLAYGETGFVICGFVEIADPIDEDLLCFF